MEIPIYFYESVPTAVSFYPTDDQSDLIIRIAVDRQIPSAGIYTPAGFDWKEFLSEPSEYVLLDLFSIMPTDFFSNTQAAFALYNALDKKYKIGIVEFTEQYLVKNLWDTTTINVEAIQSRMIFNWFPRFTKIKHKLEEWWAKIQADNALISKLISKYKKSIIDDINKNAETEKLGKEFVTTPTIPPENEEIIGYIERFHVTTNQTTGSLFDHFITSVMFPLARYKTFFKMHNNVNVKPQDTDITADLFHDLQIFNKNGDVNIHIKNTISGITVQALIADEVKSIEDVMRILGLDDEEPVYDQKFGLRIQFNLKNICFDPSLFSDMILNNALFRKFLSVNDTDKISRQNKSVYVYFKDPNVLTRLTEKDILVGGWNRAFSRYGDLTSILQCEPDGDDFKVLVRVVRSIDDTIVESFKLKIGIFFRLYESMRSTYIQLYHNLIPTFEPYQPTLIDEKGNDNPLAMLIKAEPKIFLSNIYGRNCQKVKPIIIDDPQEIEALSPARKLLFPPIEHDGMKPRYYTCPTTIVESEGVPYLYPGLKKIKKADHPFGYFPCCYKENTWEKKNITINNRIIQKLTNGDAKEDNDHKTNIEHIITRKSIIDNLGQLGTLPELLDNFLLTTNPFERYYRLGVPLMDSFLSCLEYQHAQRTGTTMRNLKVIRRAIIDSDKIMVGLQENYDIGLEGIIELLENEKSIDPKRFIRILENFYDVSIYIFYKDRNDRISLMIPHEDRSYYRYYHNKRPIVAVFQHWGGTMDELIKLESPHCELIIAQKFNTQRSYTFDARQFSWRALSELGFNFFDASRNIQRTLIDNNHLLSHVRQQLLDPLGKTRFFFFSDDNFPGYVTTPVAPLAIPIVSEIDTFPPSKSVFSYLATYQIPVIKIVQFKEYLFLYIRVENMDIIFPSEHQNIIPQESIAMTDESFDIHTILSMIEEREMILAFQEKIRVSSILQDYYLYYMAHFLKENDVTTIDIDHWIRDFMDQHTQILMNQNHLYPPVADIPVCFTKTVKNLVKNNKVLVVERVRTKLVYFLKWFYINRREELNKLLDRREIPSYYQYTSDFEKYPQQTILNSLQDIKNIFHYPFVQDVLISIDQPFLIPFYYYNNYQTGNTPLIIVRLRTRSRAIEILYIWYTTRRIDTKQHVDISDQNIIVDEPLDYVNGFLQWTSKEDAIGRISPAQKDSWLAILEF